MIKIVGTTLFAAGLALLTQPLLACYSCMSQGGENAAVVGYSMLTLLLVVLSVMAAFAGFFFVLYKRACAAEQSKQKTDTV